MLKLEKLLEAGEVSEGQIREQLRAGEVSEGQNQLVKLLSEVWNSRS
jgi:hypothetical protein